MTTTCTRPGVVERLYDVAEDDELGVLEDLLVRGRLRWVCTPKPEHPHAWINSPRSRCELCGRTERQATRHDEKTEPAGG